MPDKRHSLALFFDRATRRLDDMLQEKLRERGMFSTTRTQSFVMGNLSIGETRPSRLARNIGVSPQAMSQVLGSLVDEGLIELVSDDSDKRARIVTLTQDGERYLDTVRAIFFDMEKALEVRFSRPVMDVVRMVVQADWEELIVSSNAPAPIAETNVTVLPGRRERRRKVAAE